MSVKKLSLLKSLKINQKKNEIKDIKSTKIVIFGSSRSLLNLTKKEKKILHKIPKIFMNKNIIYWKKLKIWPEFYYLLDTPIKSKQTINIFFETLITICASSNKLPILILEKFYKIYVPKKIQSFYYNYKKSSNLKWATKNHQVLFGSHGSLTSLLNIISIMKKFKNILITGVDLNQYGYFFDNSENKFSDLVDIRKDNIEKKMNIHSNLIKINNVNILTNWKIINKNLKKNGIKLYCARKNSELVKKKLVKHLSIENFNKLN